MISLLSCFLMMSFEYDVSTFLDANLLKQGFSDPVKKQYPEAEDVGNVACSDLQSS
jgi:hypothetical protein